MGIVNLNAEQPNDFFEAAERKFSELSLHLISRQTKAMKFTNLEKLLEKEGRELLQLLLQGHIDSRGTGDIDSEVEGTDEHFRIHKRIGERQIKSIFGEIQLMRLGYGARGVESLFPKDGHLNLPIVSHSHELQRRVATEIIKGSFDNAVESIAETTGVPVPKQQIEYVTVRAASDFDAFYEKQVSDDKLEKAKEAPLSDINNGWQGNCDAQRRSTVKYARKSRETG